MTATEKLTYVESLIALARKHGVTRLTAGPVTIELGAPPEPAGAEAPPPPGPSLAEISPGRAQSDEDVCACGHSIEIEHGPGGCLVDGDCKPEVCFGAKP